MENRQAKQHRLWVAYLRDQNRRAEERRLDQHKYPDGMCHGIIPFGAIQDSLDREQRRLAAALAVPAPAWRLEADELGVRVGVWCPYCRRQHQHVIASEVWDPEAWYEAGCRRGRYRLGLR